MSKFPLDLSKFKLEHNDGKKAVLKHAHGHTMTIAVGSLSPKLKGQLDKLGSGNKAELQAEAKMAKGGKVKKQEVAVAASHAMAEGGEVDETPSPDSTSPPIPSDAGQPAAPMPESTAVPTPMPQSAPAPMLGEPAAPDASAAAPAPQPMDPQSPAANTAAPTLGSTGDTGIEPITQNLQERSDNARKSMAMESAGKLEEADALAKQGHQSANVQGDAAKTIGQYQKDYADSFANVNAHMNDTLEAMKDGKIDPNRLFANQSTGQKVQRALALFLGGLGAGLTHGENPALAIINKEIDRDVDSQKSTFGNQVNLVSMYAKQLGNVGDAVTMAKANLAMGTAYKMQQIADNIQDPIAKARMMQGIAEITNKYAPTMQQVAQSQALMKVGSGVPTRTATGQRDGAAEADVTLKRAAVLRSIGQIEQADHLTSTVIPGVGRASIPVPKDISQEITNSHNLINQTETLRKFVTDNGGLKQLNPQQVAKATVMAGELGQIYARTVESGHNTEEKKTLQAMNPDNPLGFLNHVVADSRLTTLGGSIGSRLNTTLRQYDLPTDPRYEDQNRPELQSAPKFNAQQQKFIDYAKANPGLPMSQAIIKKYNIK